MTPSGANSLEHVVSLNSHQFELEGLSETLRDTQRKRGATEADGSREELCELQLNPKITTWKGFWLICQHLLRRRRVSEGQAQKTLGFQSEMSDD